MSRIKKFLSNYKNMSVPAKAALWFTICGFIQKGISFITVPIFTRLLTTAQYGTTSVYYSWYSLFSIVCTLNLFYGGFNNGMLDYEGERDRYVSAIQGLVTTLTVGWLVIYLLGHNIWNNILEMGTPLVLIMFLEILAHSALSLWSAHERYEYRYRNLVIITVANAFFASFAAVIAIWLCNPLYGAQARIIAHAAVVVLICGCIYVNNLRKGKCFFDGKIWKGAFLFNIALLPHYLSTMILNQVDRIMINNMVGASEAGIYSVAYSVGMVLNFATTAVNNSFAPWIYEKMKNKDCRGIARVGNMMFIGLALILALLMALAPECILVFAGRKYTEATIIIPAVASSLYFIFMYQIFANVEFFWRKKNFIAYASVIGAILNIVLNYFGIKMFGYIAAGYTTLICYVVFGVAHYLFMRKICKEEMDGAELFDSKTIFITAIILVVFSFVMMFLYNTYLIRYLILATIIVILILCRKRIMNLFSTIRER